MAQNVTRIRAPVERVFQVLTDAAAYPDWVVGARSIRAVDGDWPRSGSAFHHTLGAGPLHVSDSTRIIEIDPPRRLVLSAKARPVGLVARVSLDLEQDGDETIVKMAEKGIGGLAGLLWNPLFDKLTQIRNARSLDRLKRLVEEGP
ncbi:MAG TPA: SRPBCC family protein [Actinomycetota bacterium]|nr:SRPBCC family protein [Actinomycetota bacterium]